MIFDFEAGLRQFELGNLTARPQRVTGGYLHKMFRLETTTGVYAIKLLNPLIMKRPGVLENYKRAERLERVLSEYHIPIVAAMEQNGTKMQCQNDQYFYLFEWTDAKALGWHEIKEEHCRTAGKLLARIHKIPQNDMHDISELQESIECSHGISDRKFHVDWKTLSGVGFAWLDWLEYNTKRALRIECGDEEEQKLGIREAKERIRRIAYYHSVREEVLEYMIRQQRNEDS